MQFLQTIPQYSQCELCNVAETVTYYRQYTYLISVILNMMYALRMPHILPKLYGGGFAGLAAGVV